VIDREEGTDLAKISPHILSAERFGLHLATHFVSKYAHIHKALVTIEQLRWARIAVDGKPHNHSFLRDGDEKRVVNVQVDGSRGKDRLVGNVSAGINDLLS
jgi:urate oxidase